MYVLRLAQEPDLVKIEGLVRDVIDSLPYYNQIAKKNELLKYTASELLKKTAEDSHSVIVAMKNKEVVGFCLNRIDDCLIWLEWFGVREDMRRKGLGRKLIEHLESTAKIRNAHKVWCDCRTENIKSVNFFITSNYLPVCTLKNHWYGQDFIIWEKTL